MAIENLNVQSFRCLANISLDIGQISVFFGPNGAGKSTLLDSIWFLRDVSLRGLQQASRFRSLGSQLLSSETASKFLAVTVRSHGYAHGVTVSWDDGAMAPFPEEHFEVLDTECYTAFEKTGSWRATPVAYYFDSDGVVDNSRPFMVQLAEPDRLALPLVAAQPGAPDQLVEANELLRATRFFASRDLRLKQLQRSGSPTDGPIQHLADNCSNIWAVLRHLHDRQKFDQRFGVIERYMERAFPRFSGIAFEQMGPNEVTGLFLEKDRREPLRASATPDGYLQMLILLVHLFGAPQNQKGLILLDEPDLSLHPWALFVLAEAIQDATKNWGRQVLLATHSPVLLSQFPEDCLYLMTPKDGQTTVQRLSEMEVPRDLLNQYAAGSLYMMQMIGEQSSEPMVHVVSESP